MLSNTVLRRSLRPRRQVSRNHNILGSGWP